MRQPCTKENHKYHVNENTSLLSECSYYGIEFDVKFNSAKSNVMVFWV